MKSYSYVYILKFFEAIDKVGRGDEVNHKLKILMEEEKQLIEEKGQLREEVR